MPYTSTATYLVPPPADPITGSISVISSLVMLLSWPAIRLDRRDRSSQCKMNEATWDIRGPITYSFGLVYRVYRHVYRRLKQARNEEFPQPFTLCSLRPTSSLHLLPANCYSLLQPWLLTKAWLHVLMHHDYAHGPAVAVTLC